MHSEQTIPTTVHDQLSTLGLQAEKIRLDLEASRLKLPKTVVEELRNLETTLPKISGRIEAFQKEHSNMLALADICLLYTSPSPRDRTRSRMPSSA